MNRALYRSGRKLSPSGAIGSMVGRMGTLQAGILLALLIPLLSAWQCKSSEGGKDGDSKRGFEFRLEEVENFSQKVRPPQVDSLPVNRNLFAEHYPVSNEMRIDLFRPYLEDLKGGYVGVGTDQNLTFIAWAKSDVAWLVDFDPVVVGVNRIHIFFLSRSPTYSDYLKLWDRSKKQKAESYTLILDHFKNDPDLAVVKQSWRVAQQGYNDVPMRLKELNHMTEKFGLKSFHNDPAQYQHLHRMAKEGRILALPGDLRGSHTIQGVSEAAKRLGLPIQVLYMSNAEEYFMNPPGFRKNILSFPSTQDSVVVRTLTNLVRSKFGYPEGEKYPKDFPFHYNLQPLSVMKEWMKYDKEFKVAHMLFHRKEIQKGLSIVEKTPEQAGLINQEGQKQ